MDIFNCSKFAGFFTTPAPKPLLGLHLRSTGLLVYCKHPVAKYYSGGLPLPTTIWWKGVFLFYFYPKISRVYLRELGLVKELLLLWVCRWYWATQRNPTHTRTQKHGCQLLSLCTERNIRLGSCPVIKTPSVTHRSSCLCPAWSAVLRFVGNLFVSLVTSFQMNSTRSDYSLQLQQSA